MASLVEETLSGIICDTDEEHIDNIDRILSDDNLRKEFSDNALKYVRDNIAWSKIAGRHIEIYKTIVEPSVLSIDTIWMD